MGKGRFSTPLGDLYYFICGGKLHYLSFWDRGGECPTSSPADAEIERRLIEALKRYFWEGLWDFGGIPINLSGIPPTYSRIYRTLRTLPSGSTVSYSELADMVGIKNGARVVGRAMARNPFVIVVPCHRVIGKNSPGGFSAGLEKKVALLKIEGVDLKLLKFSRSRM